MLVRFVATLLNLCKYMHGTIHATMSLSQTKFRVGFSLASLIEKSDFKQNLDVGTKSRISRCTSIIRFSGSGKS